LIEPRHRDTTDCSSATAKVEFTVVARGFSVPEVPFVPVHLTPHVIV